VISVSDELRNWAQSAGYAVDNEDGSTHQIMFWSRGGETRYFVKATADGWVQVDCSDRLQPEYFLFSGNSINVVERYLFGLFGNAMRSHRRLPLLATPMTEDELAGGYGIELRQVAGKDRYTLVTKSIGAVAIASGGKVSAYEDLVPLSVYLETPIAEIEQSFTSDDGRPLFTLLD